MATKLVNGKPVEMSPAEEAEFEASRVQTLPEAREEAMQRLATIWAQKDSYRVLLGVPNVGVRRTANENRAKGLACAIENAPSVAAVHNLDLTSGWD